jgi:hypothetical protein
MNVAALPALIEQHKKPLIAAGAAGAVGLGLATRRRSAKKGGAAGSAGAPSAIAPQLAPAGVYSSGGADTYNMFESQIANLQSEFYKAIGRIPAPTVPAAPTTPGPPSPFALPRIDSGAFPATQALSQPFSILGRITGAGGQFKGENVAGGAPVYAHIGNQWVQGFDVSALPTGTELGTPSQFSGYIVPGTIDAKYGK